MDIDLLYAKIDRLENGAPLQLRQSKDKARPVRFPRKDGTEGLVCAACEVLSPVNRQ